MIVSITGHRPEKITNPDWVKSALAQTYLEIEVTRVIQGMAAGVDLWSAFQAFMADIPYVCARPWAGHKPRKADKHSYEMAIKNAAEVVDVSLSTNYLGPWLYQARNEWMVKRAELVIAVWDGSKKGGTWNCVDFAVRKNKPVYIIDPKRELIIGAC